MNEKYQLLDELNLCHRCEKAKTVKGKKFCQDCLDKIAIYNAKHYDKDKAQQYQKRRREIYQEKKEKGICIRCNKKASYGLYCYEHSIYAKRRSKEIAEKRRIERLERGLIPEIRERNKLCLRCGNTLDLEGYKLCSKCVSENKKNSMKADKSYYRKLEKDRLEKKFHYINMRLKK